MRIVMICRMYWPHIGGVEKHVAGVSKEAVKKGQRLDIFTLKHDSSLATLEIKDGIRIHRKPNLLHSHVLKFILPALLPKKVANYIVERDEIWGWLLWNLPTFCAADIIQIHDVFFWYWPLRILLPWKKVYITYHGFEAGRLPTEKAKKTRQLIQRWTSGSMLVGEWIEKWYGTKGDIVTYGAGECTGQSSKKQEASNKGRIQCVFIGRMAEDTGAPIYEKVCTDNPGVSLEMYGEGSKLGTVEDSCVVFPKYDIACVSSYLSIVEAMQSRVLVVAYASDELKYDYLTSHPRAHDMIIVRSEEELRSFFTKYDKNNYTKHVADAYDWAQQQTWNRVYLKYKKLWNLK